MSVTAAKWIDSWARLQFRFFLNLFSCLLTSNFSRRNSRSRAGLPTLFNFGRNGNGQWIPITFHVYSRYLAATRDVHSTATGCSFYDHNATQSECAHRLSWPRMLKVAPCTVSRTVAHPNFFRLDGLLLFCIIMGLRSASSAIRVCMRYFTTALRSKTIRQILNQNTSPYFHSVSLVIWPLSLMKSTHFSELSILRFSTWIRKA